MRYIYTIIGLGVIWINSALSAQDIPSADSLYHATEQLVAQGEVNNETLLELLSAYRTISAQNPQLATTVLERAMKLAVELNAQHKIQVIHTYFGNSYRTIGLYSKALESHLAAYDKAIELDNDTMIIYSLNDAGNIYYDRQQYPEALKRYRNALTVSEECKYAFGKSVCLNNIGLVYEKLGAFDSALFYHKQALKVRKPLDNPFYTAHSLIYIGKDYINLEVYDSALTTLATAQQVADSIPDNQLYVEALIRQSDAYKGKGDTRRLLQLYNVIDSLLYAQKNNLLLTTHKVRMGRYWASIDAYQKADALYVEAIALAKKHKLILQELDALSERIALHERTGQYKKAYTYLQTFNEINDKVDEEAYIQRMRLIEAQNKAQHKAKELEALAQVSILQNEALEAQEIKNNALFGIIAVLVILGSIILWAFFQKANSNNKLMAKNAIINAQKQEIETTVSRLQAAKELAEKYSNIKTDFVSNLSHEIRTPMNAIVGLTDLLLEQQGRNDEETKRLRSIQSSADHLIKILNDVLDLSKVEAGKLTLSMAPFSVHKLADNLIFAWQQRLQKPILLSTEIDERVPKAIIGDETRLFQVLSNLISNAIKFTDKGAIKLTIQHLQSTDTTTTLKFKVTDSGIGMTSEQLAKIFQRFEQGSDQIFNQYGGTGLGLSISQKLINMHGGTLKVESKVGEGSVFSFTLTCKQATTAATALGAEADTNKPDTAGLDKVRLLYVEDNEVNRFLAEQLFIGKHTLLDFAENGRQAIDLFEKNQYDLILMDIQMPIMDGIETTKWLRKHGEQNATIPIIGFTADVMNGTKQKALKAGMNDVILKPFKKEALFAIIRKYTQKTAKVSS